MRAVSRYETNLGLAQYIETEWGDFIAKSPPFKVDYQRSIFMSGSAYYGSIASRLNHLLENRFDLSYLEFGSATGRMAYEVHRLNRFKSITLIEKSAKMRRVCSAILEKRHANLRFPLLLSEPFKYEVFQLASVFPEVNEDLQKILHISEELSLLPDENFSVVFCLNVLDRIFPNKLSDFVDNLLLRTNDEGLLVVANSKKLSDEGHRDIQNTMNSLLKRTQIKSSLSLQYKLISPSAQLLVYGSDIYFLEKRSQN